MTLIKTLVRFRTSYLFRKLHVFYDKARGLLSVKEGTRTVFGVKLNQTSIESLHRREGNFSKNFRNFTAQFVSTYLLFTPYLYLLGARTFFTYLRYRALDRDVKGHY